MGLLGLEEGEGASGRWGPGDGYTAELCVHVGPAVTKTYVVR